MASTPGSSAAQEKLGSRLRDIRQSRGLKQGELADLIGRSQAGVSRIETAKEPATEAILRDLLRALDATKSESDEIMSLLAVTRLPAHLYESIDAIGIPAKQREIAARELATSRFEEFQPAFVPGLLQTSEYAEAIFAAFKVPTVEVEASVQNRIARQRILGMRHAKSFHFVLAEAALYTSPGGNAVQLSQLEFLFASTRLPNVTIDVVPGRRGIAPVALTTFCIFDREFVSAETVIAEQQVTRQTDVALFIEAFDQVQVSAESGDGARRLIRTAIDHFESALRRESPATTDSSIIESPPSSP